MLDLKHQLTFSNSRVFILQLGDHDQIIPEGGRMSQMHFPNNLKTVNLKIFSKHGSIYNRR